MKSDQPGATSSSVPLKLSATSGADVLMAALQHVPGLLKNTFGEASAIAHRLTQNPHLPAEFGAQAFWQNAVWRYQAALPHGQPGMAEDQPAIGSSMVSALRIMLDARDALRDLEADLPLLNHADMLALRGQIPPDAAAPALAAVWNKGPGLRGWQARRQAEVHAAQARTARGEAAKTLLRRLAADGVHLTMAKGNLVAHPAAMLTEAHRVALAEFRGELASILSAPPEIISEQQAAA